MSKETRTVRPFAGLDAFSHSLEEALLYFGDAACLSNRSITVDLSPHEFLLRPVTIQWASDDTAFAHFKQNLLEAAVEAGFDPADLSIVAIATTPYLKIADIALKLPLSSIDELDRLTQLTDSSRSSAFSAPNSGFTIDAYVLLSGSVVPRPLRPSEKGTWLARVGFKVDTTLGPAVLPPTPLTPEIRKRYQLQANTIRYLHLGDHDLLAPYLAQEQPTFYVDEEILSQLNARRSAPASRALQVQLALDFASTVVTRASKRSDELARLSYDDLRSTLLGSVVRVAAGLGASEEYRERLVDLVRTDPELVIAFAEHAIGLRQAYLGSLKDGES